MQHTNDTKLLFERIGGYETLLGIMKQFYPMMFRDKQLSKFVEDQSDPHPERLAQWIAEKMTGKPIWSSTLSSRSRDQPYDRQSAHYKAWNSKRREPSRRGSHFKLDDAVIWMRLNFWACRKEGIDKHHPEFFEWYIKFISHFVAVYERRATPYAHGASQWSLDAANIAKYERDGWIMHDASSLRA